MKLILNGKSGATMDLINRNFDFFLRKYPTGVKGNARLVIQAQKQIDFYKQNAYTFIKTPEITDVYAGTSSELAYVEMKYIFGKNALSFLNEAGIFTINTLIDNLLEYTDSIFKNIKVGSTEEVSKKVEQVAALEFPNKENIMKILRKLPKEDLLAGPCHGDMTMANMVLTDSTVYLLDFLNTYVDSPILDLLSLRQDTHHLWSCLLCKNYSCRPVETLKYIDNELKMKYNWVVNSEWYRYLSLMNYVRMYPFNTEKSSTEFITNCIQEYI